MSIDINNTTYLKNDVKISYNYTSIPLYVNQFENTVNNGGFIKIPYVSNSNEANVIIVDEKNQSIQYKTEKLYITKSQNIIKDLSYTAELIIEHKSTTNDHTLFIIFLLESRESLDTKTNIDEIITASSTNGKNTPSSNNVSFQNLIDNNKKDKTVYYVDNKNTVIIFTKPYVIQSKFESSFITINPPLFTISPKKYKIMEPVQGFQNIQGFQTIEGFQEGLTQSVYCQPVDMTDPSGGEVTAEAELSIPLVGEYTPNDATNSAIRTAINLMAFVIVLGFTYMFTPILYNDFMIGLIQLKGQSKMMRIRSIDFFISIIALIFIFGLISSGVNENNANYTTVGFFLGIFYIFSFLIVQTTKMSGSWFEKTFKVGDEVKANYSNVTAYATITDLIQFLFDNMTLFIANYMLGAIVTFVLFCIFYITGAFKKGGIMNTPFGVMLYIILIITITVTAKSSDNKE